MKKMMGVFVLAALALVTVAVAQSQVRSDIAADRAALQADRQAIVAKNLPLTDDQAKAFWPVYREYHTEMAKLGDKSLDLVLGYAKNYQSLTDEQATTMLNDFLAIQKDEAKMKSDWAPKFSKILPPKTVARFFQIENKLDAILRFQAADQIPLVDIGKK